MYMYNRYNFRWIINWDNQYVNPMRLQVNLSLGLRKFICLLCEKLGYTCKFWKHIVPVSGQFLGGLHSSISKGASLLILEYCSILSTDIILFSVLQTFQMIDASWPLRFNPYVTANPAIPVKHEHRIRSSKVL